LESVLISTESRKWGNNMQRNSCAITLKLLGLCALLSATNLDFALAQAPQKNRFGSGQRQRRTVSPYLSTLDNGQAGGADNALNYFNIVKPQQQGAKTAKNLQNELRNVESSIDQPRGSGEPSELASITTGRLAPTGHGASFSDLQQRFGSAGGGSSGHSSPYGFGGDGRGYTNAGSITQRRGGYGKGVLGGKPLFGAAFGRQ
jgi:hypothetical protein